MSSECRDCRSGVQHCHGTVIHHIRSRSECTEDGCATPEMMHGFSIDCEAVGCACGQSEALAI